MVKLSSFRSTMKFESLLNNFLTSGIKTAAPEIIKKIRVLNLLVLVFVISSFFLGLFYFYIGAVSLFYACMIAGFMGLSTIPLLRMTHNTMLTGNFSVFILWALLIIIRWNTGGISANGLILLSWVWNAVLILLAVFVAGYLWGTIWASLVFVESGITIYLFQYGYFFNNIIPKKIIPFYSLGAYLLGLLMILLFAFLFEKDRADAIKREQEKTKMLSDSNKHLENIIERLPIPTYVLDNNHRVVQWNRACRDMTGISYQDIVGKRVCEGLSLDKEGSMADKFLYNPDIIPEEFGKSIISRSDSGSTAVKAFLPNLKGGIHSIINTAPLIDQEGNVKGVIEAIQHLSDPENMSETMFGFQNNSINDIGYPAFKIDSHGKISGWNEACEESLGYSLSRMLGQSPLLVVSKPFYPIFKQAIAYTFKKGRAIKSIECAYQTKTGQIFYALSRIEPIHDTAGELRECRVISTNITNLKIKIKKMERDTAKNNAKLSSLNNEYNLLKKNIAGFLRKKKN